MKKLCIITICIALVICLAGCNSSDYKKAVEDFNAGQYAAAMQEFQNLKDYQDSAAYVNKCAYALAVADFEGGKYEEAKAQFAALNGFEDSTDYVEKCELKITEKKYEAAVSLFESGDYEAAEQAFMELNDFEDSAEYIEKAEHALQIAAFTGTWKTEALDMSAAITNELIGMDEVTASLLAENPLPSLSMEITMDLHDDETYELSGTITGAKEFSDSFGVLMGQLFMAEMTAELEAEGLTMQDVQNTFGTTDMNEIFEIVNGVSMDDFLDLLDLEGMVNEYADDLTDSGTYTIEENAIVLDGTTERYELSEDGTKLTVIIDAMLDYFGTSEIVFTRG